MPGVVTLSNELLTSIATYLEHEDRVTATHVCRKWRTVYDSDLDHLFKQEVGASPVSCID